MHLVARALGVGVPIAMPYRRMVTRIVCCGSLVSPRGGLSGAGAMGRSQTLTRLRCLVVARDARSLQIFTYPNASVWVLLRYNCFRRSCRRCPRRMTCPRCSAKARTSKCVPWLRVVQCVLRDVCPEGNYRAQAYHGDRQCAVVVLPGRVPGHCCRCAALCTYVSRPNPTPPHESTPGVRPRPLRGPHATPSVFPLLPHVTAQYYRPHSYRRAQSYYALMPRTFSVLISYFGQTALGNGATDPKPPSSACPLLCERCPPKGLVLLQRDPPEARERGAAAACATHPPLLTTFLRTPRHVTSAIPCPQTVLPFLDLIRVNYKALRVVSFKGNWLQSSDIQLLCKVWLAGRGWGAPCRDSADCSLLAA